MREVRISEIKLIDADFTAPTRRNVYRGVGSGYLQQAALGQKTVVGTQILGSPVPLIGGKSTGPRTPEGLERCRMANWKHGLYCKQALEERHRLRELLRNSARFLRELEEKSRPAKLN